MGSCFSKSEKEVSEKPVTSNSRKTNSKLTTTEQRLGGKDTDGTGAGRTLNDDNGTGNYNGSTKTTSNAGHKLGAKQDSMNSGNSGTREAAARAAELRYNQQQEKLKASQGKLKAMSKMSRQEKGL